MQIRVRLASISLFAFLGTLAGCGDDIARQTVERRIDAEGSNGGSERRRGRRWQRRQAADRSAAAAARSAAAADRRRAEPAAAARAAAAAAVGGGGTGGGGTAARSAAAAGAAAPAAVARGGTADGRRQRAAADRRLDGGHGRRRRRLAAARAAAAPAVRRLARAAAAPAARRRHGRRRQRRFDGGTGGGGTGGAPQCYTVAFTAPTNGATLTVADDTNTTCADGFQYTVAHHDQRARRHDGAAVQQRQHAARRPSRLRAARASFAVQLTVAGAERAVDPVPEHGGVHRSDHAVDGHGELPEHAADLQHLAADDQRDAPRAERRARPRRAIAPARSVRPTR